MSVIENIWTGLGLARDELYHCWECDANFLVVSPPDECVYCGSADLSA